MIIKCGTDLVLDSRIAKNLENKGFIDRIYHESEHHGLNPKKLAGIFALKECVFKALNIPTENWLNIEVTYDKSGKPLVNLGNEIRPKNLISLDCSVSHENGLTQAMVMILLDEEE